MIQQIKNYLTSLLAPKNRAQGIDGSHWWGKFVFEQAVKPVHFIILKATEGITMIDMALRVNWEGARQVPVRGMYHYQRSGMSWVTQAEFFLRTVALYDIQILALDVEKYGNEAVFAPNATGQADTFFSDMFRIIEHWRYRQPGKRVILYTNHDIYQNYLYPAILRVYGLQGKLWLDELKIWIANYNGQGVDGEPTMPINRRAGWTFWQYSDAGRKEDYGTQGAVDLNVFNGTVEQLHAWAGVDGPTPPPVVMPPIEPPLPDEPTPEPEEWTGRVIAFDGLKIRNYPLREDRTDTGQRLKSGEPVSGRLWEGNGYVWMKLDAGRWVAVRKPGGDKFIRLDPQPQAPSLPPSTPGNLAAIVWDDQNPDYQFRCRTLADGFIGPDNPPAVMRFYPVMRENAGDFSVDIRTWRDTIIRLNGGDTQKFNYWIGIKRAQFNSQGWPMLKYVGMCGNKLNGEVVGRWFRFETLMPSDVARARGMTIHTHPQFIHRFTCVTWDARNQVTRRINSTGTARGDVFFPLITKEGFAYIPLRHVVLP